mmetsp:Transcript_388/g.360  ORF Transcript_388/g.360 Transcript_388/m.360 type:complete len:190 (+) Transcript_388:451-1020(+)
MSVVLKSINTSEIKIKLQNKSCLNTNRSKNESKLDDELSMVMLGESQRSLVRGESLQKESFCSAYNNFEDVNHINEAKNRFKVNNKKNLSIFKVKSSNSPLRKSVEIQHQTRPKTKFEDYNQDYKDIGRKYLTYKNFENSIKSDIKIVNQFGEKSMISLKDVSNLSSSNSMTISDQNSIIEELPDSPES